MSSFVLKDTKSSHVHQAPELFGKSHTGVGSGFSPLKRGGGQEGPGRDPSTHCCDCGQAHPSAEQHVKAPNL